MFLFKIGLIINILVAGGLGASLINKNLHIKVYGEDSASGQILSSKRRNIVRAIAFITLSLSIFGIWKLGNLIKFNVI